MTNADRMERIWKIDIYSGQRELIMENGCKAIKSY